MCNRGYSLVGSKLPKRRKIEVRRWMEMVWLCKAGTGSSGYHPRSWLPSYRVGCSAALQAAALAPSSSAQRSDQSCRRSWPESRCVPSFGKGRCAYYFFMTFQLEFLKQFKGGWHFRYMLDGLWTTYSPMWDVLFPANPSVSKNIPPLFQSANGSPLDFLLGKRKDRSSNPWDAGAAAKSAMDMLDGLKALATITMKIHPTILLFSSRSKMPIFFTVSILQFNRKCFKQKQKKDWSFEQAIMIWACWAFFSATCGPMVNCPCLSL